MFVFFLVSGLTALRQAPPVAILMFALAPCFVLLYGGLCITITQSVLRVKLGRLGLTLRTIKLSEIAEVTVREFNALHDFGGFGIRRGMGGTTAYFYRGSAVRRASFCCLRTAKKSCSVPITPRASPRCSKRQPTHLPIVWKDRNERILPTALQVMGDWLAAHAAK